VDLLTPHDGELLLRIARSEIEYAVAQTPKPKIHYFPVLDEKRGVFVTLTRGGQLRGCIGFPYPVMPLGEAIRQAAVAAALEDPRFRPVQADELGRISFEVTVLTVPVSVEGDPEQRPGKVAVGRHGLIIKGRGTSGLLLPQVATDYGWDAKTFLDHTCIKAGLPAGSWRDPRVELLTFEGQIFSDHR
jgi:AmmeMemoRadiSam system protein A